MDNQIIQNTVEHLKDFPSINHDEVEEWILTPEEESLAKKHALFQLSLKTKGFDANHKMIRAQEYLSEYEIKKLLVRCNSNKHQQIWQEQQSKKRRDEENTRLKELHERCNANYFYNLIKRTSEKDLIKTDETLSYIKTICFFFSSDKRFETELNLNLQKGLWIRGNAGVGKSFVLQCIQENDLIPFKIHSMIDIASDVSKEGIYEISEPLKVIDDVGSEQSIVNHYGTKINWFKDFIELYYAQKKPFYNLIVTTNFDFGEVEKSYGFRVRSRVKDMFNVIDVKGQDLRGKQ